MHVTVNPSAVYAELEDGAVILNVDTGIYYGLNPVGSRVWALIGRGASTVDAIVTPLQAEYAVAPDTLHADVTELLGALEAKGLLQVAAS